MDSANSGSSLSELKCAVCSQRGHGCHFGVVACRPCAAFFRRCITKNQNYKCLRGTNECGIREEGHRNACKACRLRLCRIAGMTYNLTTEEESRDAYADESDDQEQCPSNSFTQQKITSEESRTQNLDKIERAHNAFIAGQRSLFMAIHPSAAFHDRTLITSISIADYVQMYSGSKPLFYSMLNDSLKIYSQMESQMKLSILDCCYRQFSLLHSCYLTICQFPDPDDPHFIASFGNVIDVNNLDVTLASWAQETSNAEEYIRLKKPLIKRYYKFISGFKHFSVDIQQRDICALIAVTFWNIVQQEVGQLEPEWEMHKEAIFSEWLQDLEKRFDSETSCEPAILMGRLLCSLVELNTLAYSMEEATTLFRIFMPEMQKLCPDAVVPSASQDEV